MYMQHRKQVSLVVEHMIEPEAEGKDNPGQLGILQCKTVQNRAKSGRNLCKIPGTQSGYPSSNV